MANLSYGTKSSAHASYAADAAAVVVRPTSSTSTASTAAKNQWTGKYLWCPHICMDWDKQAKEVKGGRWRHATPESRAQLEAGNGQLATGSRLVWSLPKWQKLTVAYAKWSLTRLGVNAWRQEHRDKEAARRRGETRWGRRKRGCLAINRHKNKLQLPSMNKFHCNLLCIPFFRASRYPCPIPWP